MQYKHGFFRTVFHTSLLGAAGAALFATVIYTWTSGQDVYSFLWTKIASVPVVLFVLGGSVLLGGAIGYAAAQQLRRRVNTLSAMLMDLERGNLQVQMPEGELDELGQVEKRIAALGGRLQEQTALFQRIASERTEWSEELRQEAISQERHRLARELHDSVSQQLFAMSMMMSAVNAQEQACAEPVRRQLQLIENMIVNAQSEMRALLLHLRPVQLEGKKLAEGIDELLTELSRKQHIRLEWLVDPVQLNRGVEDHLFRILQEALSNTLRHAKAKKMEVRLRAVGGQVILKVLDDGVGFQVEQRKAGAYGLQSIQERVQEIGGTWKIISFPGKGTQLEVKVPMIEQGDEA
ncbi:sensor histidine kinase [Ectobacillus ponti]|uniref:Sensor histidine kinase n=1 Tax=Ectobacillus ponti TaxID=2961894 RepID=A0AA42BP38_9BACI|nr:sensor histidine kinase [Ectobacillus ponti]MCP8968680.1 sensor histidine kinase [Ectobacillus ponti]